MRLLVPVTCTQSSNEIDNKNQMQMKLNGSNMKSTFMQ
jgi:hypothetical protein